MLPFPKSLRRALGAVPTCALLVGAPLLATGTAAGSPSRVSAAATFGQVAASPAKAPVKPAPVKTPVKKPAPVKTPVKKPAPVKTPVKKPAPVKTPVAKPSPVKTTKAVFESRITAGNGVVKDSAGRLWQPRPVEFGSWRMSKQLVGRDIGGTRDDALYQVNGFDLKWYRLKVPAAATYRVRLLMAESYWSEAGKRVFDVRAEGKTVAKDIDIFRAVGKGNAHQVTFTVPVRDGELTLEFPATRDYSLVSAIEVVSTTPVPPAPKPTAKRAVSFAPTSFWTQDVSRAPLAPNSAPVVADLARQVADHYGGVAAFNAYEYNAAFYVASTTDSRIRVGYHNCQRKRGIPRGLYDGPKHFVDVPVPKGAVPARGTDGMMNIYDPARDSLWEFWQMRQNDRGGWEACWGGRLDQVSKKQGYFPEYFGTSSSGMALVGGVITADEVRAGSIEHAIALGVIDSRVWPHVSWPAQRTDGNSRNPNVVMHGQRLRLDPTLNLDAYDLTPIGRMVAKAAQKYGFIVVDRSGAVAVATQSGVAEAARTGVNPWDRLLAGPTYTTMKNFPWDKLQALPPNHGKDVPRVEK